MIRVRFAPSPTGYLHIGGARTALFNWMCARSQKGVFILRIEDTDQQRSDKKFEVEILDSMRWLGLDWDELYYQSRRFEIYRQHAEQLLSEGKARKDGGAIILKMSPGEEIKIYDLIRGEITFDSSDLKDQVLIKSDGSPAYSFCCVVDDALMEISHVIRGEDHISNTPKQIMICRALGWTPPKYAHLPLIMGADGARLSKRNGAVAVSDYRKQGFIPEALVNYLMLLGWSPGNNQEIMALDAAVKKFSIKKVNKTAAIFSMDKLRWVTSQYFKAMPTADLAARLVPRLQEAGYISKEFDRQLIENIVSLYKGRLSTLQDLPDWADYAFVDDFSFDEEAKTRLSDGGHTEVLQFLAEAFSGMEDFNAQTAYNTYKTIVEARGLKPQDLVHYLRVVLTGKSVGPGLFEIIGVLGKDKTVRRLQQHCQSTSRS
jgi:glutamyl-tRNA synthetase